LSWWCVSDAKMQKNKRAKKTKIIALFFAGLAALREVF